MSSELANEFQHKLWVELDAFDDDAFAEVVDTIIAQIGYRHGEGGLKRFGLNVIMSAADIAANADVVRFALWERELKR